MVSWSIFMVVLGATGALAALWFVNVPGAKAYLQSTRNRIL